MFKRRLNSVYYRLIISYIVLVLLTTALAGFASIAYFSHSYRQEVEKINTKLLLNLAKTLDDNIIMQAEKTCIDLSIEQQKNRDLLFFFDNPIEGNSARISSVFNYLRSVVSGSSEMINSLSVYYLENNLTISSEMGVLFLDKDDTKKNIDMSWLKQVDDAAEHIYWIEEKLLEGPTKKYNLIEPNSVAVIFSYPITYAKSKITTKGYIVLELNRAILDYTITQSTSKELGQVLIINREGKVISGNPNDGIKESLVSNKTKLFENASGSYQDNIGGHKFLSSYIRLSNTDWCLIDMTPTEQFTGKVKAIITPLIYMCLTAIILGLLVANRFTARIYNPLKSITDNTVKLFTGNLDNAYQDKDEYGMINTVIDELSSKVNRLETTLNKNMPFINYHLVNGLLNNKIKSKKELRERLRLSAIKVDKVKFCVFLIDIGKNQIKNLTIENSQYIKYSLIEFINGFNSNDINIYTVELSDNIIASVINFEDSIKLVHKLVKGTLKYIYSDFTVEALVSVGITVYEPMDIYKSFNAAENTIKYSFFLVDKKVLLADELLDREKGTGEINEELLDDYKRGLNIKSLEIVKKALSEIKDEMEGKDYSWDHCQQTLSRLIFIYCNYVKALNYKKTDILQRDIYDWFNDIENIIEFNDWLINIIETTFDYADKQAEANSSEVIQKVKQYIVDNLKGDLSLISAAEYVNLTPNYLSKIFKDNVGGTFIDYVMEQRLSKAKDFIADTDKNMGDIANEVGYSSASYLIRKFKECYGVTPNQYRNQQS